MRKLFLFLALIVAGCGGGGVTVKNVVFEKRMDEKGKPIYWTGMEWTNNSSKPVTKLSGTYFIKDEKDTLLEEINYVLYEGSPVNPGQTIKDEYGATNGADGYMVGFPGIYEDTVGGIPAKVEVVVTSSQ